jgi:hypothetical protein
MVTDGSMVAGGSIAGRLSAFAQSRIIDRRHRSGGSRCPAHRLFRRPRSQTHQAPEPTRYRGEQAADQGQQHWVSNTVLTHLAKF